MELTWRDDRFEDLGVGPLYQILELRSRVFVVEQRCVYKDLDGLDYAARHLWASEGGRVVAYLRILPAGLRYAEASLGRVVVDPAARRTGLGQELMRRGLAAVGPVAVRIAAQAYLESFYDELGFRRASETFDEDGILHVEMVRPAGS